MYFSFKWFLCFLFDSNDDLILIGDCESESIIMKAK